MESDAVMAVKKLNKTDFQGRKMLIGACSHSVVKEARDGADVCVCVFLLG